MKPHGLGTGAAELDAARRATPYVDSDHPDVAAYARGLAEGARDDTERAVRLFDAVRDDVRYDPYRLDLTPHGLRASTALTLRRGFCVPKAALLAACARAVGIPARLGFGDVVNHLTSPRLRALLGTDRFVWHGWTELYLGGRWVKATPAFNRELCERAGTRTLEFDGRADAIYHPYDLAGRRHMTYVARHGTWLDIPREQMLAAWQEAYDWPRLERAMQAAAGRFEDEVDRVDRSA